MHEADRLFHFADADITERDLPEPVIEKIIGWRNIADGGHAASHAAFDELQAKRAERASSVAELETALVRFPNLSAEEDVLEARRARIAKLDAEIRRLADRHSAAATEASSARALLDVAEKHLKRIKGKVNMYGGARPSLLKNETPLDAIERCGRRGRELCSDRDAAHAAPIPSDVANDIANRQSDAMIQRVRPMVDQVIDHGEPFTFPTVNTRIDLINSRDVAFVPIVDPVGLLAWLFPEQFRAAMAKEIAAVADDNAALTAEQRTAKLKRIEADLLAIGRDEVAFCEMAGILPRADLDVRALLGLSSGSESPSVVTATASIIEDDDSLTAEATVKAPRGGR